MAEESDKKRKATSELPMREEAMLSPSNKSDLHTKIDVDSDEIPRLKKGTRSVTALRHGVRKNKLIANEFPPGIVQTVRVALFQQTQEPQCGANLVRNLCAQNLIPPKSIARELLDVIKFGPKAEGGRSLQTEVASSYACALVSASSRLVRRDGSAIFGPSTWDDVEVLLSQSTDRAMSSSGLLFAHELQMAACGAKLLSLLLKTELLDFNLSSTDFDFNSESLRAKPTVAILKKQGLSNVLKTATRHTIKCLVRHSKWLLDSDIDMPPYSHPNHGQCCAAKTCLDSLGSVMCYTAWLFCAEERVSINHFSCAIIIRDVVLSELSLCDDSLPKMDIEKKEVFVTKLKLHFLLSLLEAFAFPIQDLVGKLIGVEDELDCFHEETTKQEGDAVHDVGNVGRSSTHQLVRKSSVPVLVQRQNDLVEAYELENKDSSVFWVEYVSDGKCVPVSSDRIIRGRKRNPRPSRRPTYKVDPLLPTRMGKSSRFLAGKKIIPLDKNIIQDDLRQMETYDKACKRFRIQSFLSSNQESTEGVQLHTKADPTPTVTDDPTLCAPPPTTPTQISHSNPTQNQSQHHDLSVDPPASPDSSVVLYNKKIVLKPPIIDVDVPLEARRPIRRPLPPGYETTPYFSSHNTQNPTTMEVSQIFPFKLYHILEWASTSEFSSALNWSSSGQAFVVHDRELMIKHIIPKFFDHERWISFTQQLYKWGFKREDAEEETYFHQYFKRGRMEELQLIRKRKYKSRPITKPTSDLSLPHQSSNVVTANHNHGFKNQDTNPHLSQGESFLICSKGAPEVLRANSVTRGELPTAAYNINMQGPSQMSTHSTTQSAASNRDVEFTTHRQHPAQFGLTAAAMPKHDVFPRCANHTYRNFSTYIEDGGKIEKHKKSERNFPARLHAMLSDEQYSHIISWMPHGRAWKVLDKKLLVEEAIPKFFGQSMYTSFTRQLSGWGFKRLHQTGPYFGCYYHECFIRGHPRLTGLMRRVAPGQGKATPNIHEEPDFYLIAQQFPLEKSAISTSCYDAAASDQLNREIACGYGRIPYSPDPRPSPHIRTAMPTPAQTPRPPAYAPCPPRISGTPNHYPPAWTLPPRTTTFLEKMGKTPHS